MELLVTGALFLAPCTVILVHSLLDGTLLALHAAMNALAFSYSIQLTSLFVCVSALYLMLKRKSVTNYATRVQLTKWHLYLNLLAGALITLAGMVAFIAKRNVGERHFASKHSWSAMATTLFFALNIFQGLLLTYEGKKPNWQWKDETHIMTGAVIYIGGGDNSIKFAWILCFAIAVTMYFGVQTTEWGLQRFGKDQQYYLSTLIIMAHVALVLRTFIFPRKQPISLQKHD